MHQRAKNFETATAIATNAVFAPKPAETAVPSESFVEVQKSKFSEFRAGQVKPAPEAAQKSAPIDIPAGNRDYTELKWPKKRPGAKVDDPSKNANEPPPIEKPEFEKMLISQKYLANTCL